MREVTALLREVSTWTGVDPGWTLRQEGRDRLVLSAARPPIAVAAGGTARTLLTASFGNAGQVADALERIRLAVEGDGGGNQVLRSLPQLAGDLLQEEGSWERWRVTVRLVEALHPSCVQRAAAGDGEARLLLPLLERGRFLLLSEPARMQLEDDDAEVVAGAFGGRAELAWRARQARDTWALALRNPGGNPLLEAWPAAVTEREACLLVLRRAGDRGPLRLQPTPASGSSLARSVLRELLLPRFAARASWRVARLLHPAWLLALPLALWAAAPAVVVALVALAVWVVPLRLAGVGAVTAAAWIGLAGYAFAALATILAGPSASYLYGFRIPSGVALGLSVLVALAPAQWRDGPHPLLVGLFAGAAFLYLAIEARNHTVAPWWVPLRRAGLILVLGLAHGVAVAAPVLLWVAPVFTPGFAMPEVLSDAAGLLALAASAGLALGVILQVLWDDRPITYPLAHLG